MKIARALFLIPFAFGSSLSVSDNQYKFEAIKFDQIENKQNIYEPKDKFDENIINVGTYSTKFVPLINDGAEGSEFNEFYS